MVGDYLVHNGTTMRVIGISTEGFHLLDESTDEVHVIPAYGGRR